VDDLGNPLVLVDQLCQAYHWSYKDAMRMTLPQIIMLNHAASVNSARMRNRMDAKTATKATQKVEDEKDPVVYNGKRLSELSSEEFATYFSF